MFESAYKSAAMWTFPIINSARLRDGRISTSLGTGFLVNDQGYFLTAAHVVASHPQNIAKIEHGNNRDAQAASIKAAGLPKSEERKQLRALGKPTKDDPINVSLSIWLVGNKSEQFESLSIDNYGDIAVGKIANYVARDGQTYPTFTRLNDAEFPAGKSLCTLGHAFHSFKTEWDDVTNSFKILSGGFPVPRFPMDSILTRGVEAEVKNKDDNTTHQRKFIELSSPGLRGQSGGPVYDVNATIFGLQSKTLSHELQFETKEKQYFHVGIAVHPNSICDFLDQNNVIYDSQ